MCSGMGIEVYVKQTNCSGTGSEAGRQGTAATHVSTGNTAATAYM